ncbi:hypothetical protein AB0M28_34990 [Streptomyces sp. NPDC051940]|uniref:hypothetical protein n=1 Tax=Streptomyces sp. NPDC051940 TaxID=3155675 RepID=UPI0034462B34
MSTGTRIEVIGAEPWAVPRPSRRVAALGVVVVLVAAGVGLSLWRDRDVRYEVRAVERIGRDYRKVSDRPGEAFLALPEGALRGPGVRAARGFNVDYAAQDAGAGRPRGALVVDAAWGDVPDPGAAVDAALARVEAIPGYTLGPARRTAPAPEGTVLRCAPVHTGGRDTTACAWADRDTVGVLLGPGPAEALRIRGALRVEGG